MLFKTWKDIVSSPSRLKEMLELSPLFVEIKDEYLARIVLQKIKKEQRSMVLFAQELTPGRLEDEFFNLCLFDSQEPIIVLNAQDLPRNSIELLKERKEDIHTQQKKTLFIATKHNPSLVRIFSHSQSFELPRFWEFNQLLNLFSSHFNLAMDESAQNFFIDCVTQATGHYFEACGKLSSAYPSTPTLGQEHLKKVLTRQKRDNFALSRNLGEQRWRDFYQDLLQGEFNYDELREVFAFLQLHMVKLVDPSYAQSKKKISQYDRQVQAQSQKWNQSELLQCLKVLAGFELHCKTKDFHLKNNLRINLIKNS